MAKVTACRIQHDEDLCNTHLTQLTFKSEKKKKPEKDFSRKIMPGDQTQDFRLGDMSVKLLSHLMPHFLSVFVHVRLYCLEIW